VEMGRYNSLAIDSKDKVHISYYNQQIGSLRYMTNKNGRWQYRDLDAPAELYSHAGFGTGLAIDGSDNVHIAYHYYYESGGSNHQIVKYTKLTF
jgi:hypothetical protein